MAKKAKQQIKEEESESMDTSEIQTDSKKDSDKSSYEELLNHVSIIAKPMASRKLTKRIYKLLKKGNSNLNFKTSTSSKTYCFFLAAPHKGYVRNGLKDVQRRIRLGEKG